MTPELTSALGMLSASQRMAADWDMGAMLVLAGPGVGKTTVLTTRIARILEESRDRHFRILALTFTTKAGDEMRNRVEAMVPGLVERTVIGTFHSFCAQILRQHGSHVGIRPDFAIYDQDRDRTEILADALNSAGSNGEAVTREDSRWLPTIDQLRGRLVGPNKAAGRFRDASVGRRVSRIYSIYEQALRENNALDFNGLILDACRLAHSVPGVAARVRQSYPYWMIDEFQDTTLAQYRFVRLLAGDDFDNIFAVADDDQIIYEWAGASYKRIVAFREHYSPNLIQLVENRRCPPQVVMAANRLISHNSGRTPGKERLVPTRAGSGGVDIRQYSFQTDVEEARTIAREVSRLKPDARGRTAILGRTRKVLEPVLKTLRASGVRCSLATRREQFVSPQFVWLQNALNLSLRPTDRQSFAGLVGAGNRMAGLELDAEFITAEATPRGGSLLEYWAIEAKDDTNEMGELLSEFAMRLVQSRASWRRVLKEALDWLPTTAIADGAEVSDVDEDKAAWQVASRSITQERGGPPELDELLQGIALRPKEPPLEPNTVRLLTIHGAKGLEFDNVWVMGIADSILPSWQSLKSGANPAELEEERRNLFVAITRTRRKLVLSYAKNYAGWQRNASRFLAETGPLGDE